MLNPALISAMISRETVGSPMGFPVRVCSVCSEKFELRPDKPGFANRCPACSEPDDADSAGSTDAGCGSDRELNAARKKAMKDLLYRKDS
jgi:hypothetical protein